MPVPRVLWVTAEPPDLHLGGGNIRQANLLLALAGRADVDLLLAGELRDDTVRAAISRVVEVAADVPGPRSKARMRVGGLWHALRAADPEEVELHRANRARLAAVAGDGTGYDVVTVEHTALAPLVPSRKACPWAITLQYVTSQWVAQVGSLAPGRRQAWWWRQEQRKARALEARIATSFDLVVAPSDDDASHLPGPVTVVPNGVDTDRFVPATLPAAPRLVFTGTLGYLPNVEGIVWFCRDVLPIVRRAVPAVTLDIVGRNPVPEVAALGGLPGIAVHEHVPSVLPYLHEARIAVVPLRVGTGTRLKALEAMAAGRPVVGTTVGVEGLGLVDGRDALIADDAGALARHVIDLLEDDERAAALAATGRALVEERFSWKTIGAAYANALLSLTSAAS
jgi:polysaccharide biosynthesis protein PslH